jgi:hypothetical protein
MREDSLETIAKECKSRKIRLIDFQQAVEIAGETITYCGLAAQGRYERFCDAQGEEVEIGNRRKKKTVYVCIRKG